MRRGHGKGKNDPSGGWEGQFQELLAFKQRHGHCVVPICRIDLCRRFLRCHDAEEQAGRDALWLRVAPNPPAARKHSRTTVQ